MIKGSLNTILGVMNKEQFVNSELPEPEKESELNPEDQVNLAVAYLKALYRYNKEGGLDSTPPLSNQEYAEYDADQDPVKNEDFNLWTKRMGYHKARKNLEEAEEGLSSAGVTPDRSVSDFLAGLPEDIAEQVREKVSPGFIG